MVPAPYLTALERMQDDVQPVPSDLIRGIIEEELGVRLNRLFQEFDDVLLSDRRPQVREERSPRA